MNRLVAEITRRVRERVQNSLRNLNGPTAELRSVFHGPPQLLLQRVFEQLAEDGGIEAHLPNGQIVKVPVVLQLDRLPTGQGNPSVGASGVCDDTHFLNLRNSPSCPRFVALLPPGRHTSLSFASASDEFGLSADSNSGNATVEEWWRDEFVQGLVDSALSRATWPSEGEKDQAKSLVDRAIRAADEIDRHDVSRLHAWCVLSRLFSITGSDASFASSVSLACGFPPMQDGTIRAEEQVEVLKRLAGDLEEDGFRTGIGRIKEDADPTEQACLDEFLAHVQRTCEVATMFGRATPFYYGPAQGEGLETPPRWWQHLTVERWIELLEEERQPEGSLRLECTNSIIPRCRGINALVLGEVQLSVGVPDDSDGVVEVTVTREVSGAANTRTWSIDVQDETAVQDQALPLHRTPARYSAEAHGLKKASVKIVSLQTWDPGVFVYCRTASKITPPKKARANREDLAFECSLSLTGQGRHYVDVYVRHGVTLDPQAQGYDASGLSADGKVSPVAQVSENAFGFEVDAIGDCYYDLVVHRDGHEAESIRLHITCDDTAAEGCRTEFERLIRLNRQPDQGRATTDVQLDRQVRSTDLQTWLLDKGRVERSFYPMVISTDYALAWRSPEWRKREDSILSRGHFLHDPRPLLEELVVPKDFLESRRAIAEKIRGEDDGGLVESARLGEWLVTDAKFSEHVERYVQSYLAWLEADRDNAAWVDLAIVCGLEPDGSTLAQDPDAVLVHPLHPIRLAWHAIAQRTLFLAYQRNMPCPAASVLDPDSIPDTLVLPLRTAAGTIQRQAFFSVECSSDYWSILWNAARLDRLATRADQAPFDQEFGVRIGGVSSGFSVSQVQRALDDVAEMFAAKPVLNILVSSAAGQTNACNEGLLVWCRNRFGFQDTQALTALGPRQVQILDERRDSSRPEDAEISNLAEDTGNAVRWFAGNGTTIRPDLGIIAQLETSNAGQNPIEVGSPVGIGCLIRHRVRRQLQAGAGAFLTESRMGVARAPSGDGLADKLMSAVVRVENLGDQRLGYTFAPSVHAIRTVLDKADFAAVSSAVVDPACFLGGWLPESYLWDYDLPSYSHRSGDTNGYYLLSRVKEIDCETLKAVLSRLPGCGDLPDDAVQQIILEVARRGIPTVRGLSGGDAGASGDLGLFVASRLIQDEFRQGGGGGSLLPVIHEDGTARQIVLVVPVDPFRGYLDDLQRTLRKGQSLRPDLLIAGIRISDSSISCRLTPLEVKYRSGREPMSVQGCQDALTQAQSLTTLFVELQKKAADPDLLMWKIAFQHLLISMLSFGFRVYSQQRVASNQSREWTSYHARFVQAILADELKLECDTRGRLVVIDGSPTSGPRDIDEDGFRETITLCPTDAASIVKDQPSPICALVRDSVGDWELLPRVDSGGARAVSKTPEPTTSAIKPESTPAVAKGTTSRGVVGDNAKKATASDQRTPEAPSVVSDKEGASLATADAGAVTPNDQATSTGGAGIEIFIGHTVDGFRSDPRRLNLSDTNLNQLNIGVVGDLGTGKTQLLKSLVYQVCRSASANQGVKPRFLIFDYKRDYSAPEFVNAVGARVVKPQHLPINLFDVSGAGDSLTPWLDRFKFFSDVLDKIFAGIGPVQRKQLKDAVREAYGDCQQMGRQPTIYDIHAKYRGLLGNKSDSPLSIIDDLVDMEMFAPEPVNAKSFDQFLDGVVVIALDALGQDDRTKNMLVAIMLNMFYEHMLKIQKRPYIGTDPQLRVIDSFLLVDEADNIMRYEFDVLRKILLQGREFGVGVILASQYLRHFKAGATDYREPLLSWFIHKVPNVTPQELGALGLTADVAALAERVKTLAKHQCLFKTQGIAGDVVKGIPFYELLAIDSGRAS